MQIKRKTKVKAEDAGLFSRAKRAVSGKIYDIKVALQPKQRRQRSIIAGKKRQLIFYVLFLAFPVAQFCVFYLGVNFNSILLAFKRYSYDTGQYSFWGFQNFRDFLSDIKLPGSPLNSAVWNSLKLYLISTIIGVTLALLFSYHIYKKKPGSGLFRIVLFMPSIISSVVMVILFKYFTERAIPELADKIFDISMTGPLSQSSTRFSTLIFYTIWVGFGTNVLMYTGAMGRIPPELTECASLDGITVLKEFWHITLPLIYPTLTAFLVVGATNLFSNQAHIFDFYGGRAPDESIYTIGYFLFRRVIGENSGLKDYPYAAAGGLIFTFIAVPVTLIFRWTLEKLGPSVEY